MENSLKCIVPIDLCSLLKKKFVAEQMDRFFTIDENFEFQKDEFSINPFNSLFLKFKGIDENQFYNLLVIFSLCDEINFDFKIQNIISRVAENNIDKIVIWVKNNIDENVISVLKQRNTDFLFINGTELDNSKHISCFYPVGENYEYAVTINKLCDLMGLRLKKLFHLVLSEIAAPTYDKDYGTVKVGTKAIMAFEEEVLNRSILRLKHEKSDKDLIAVDVGCGTGRHSLDVLTNYFSRIYGFDFSPKMIEEAKRKKRERKANNVILSISDMEYEKTPYEEEYHGKTDFIVASFGMGSFVEDTPKMLRRFYEWLSPGGYIFLSFYNKESILLKIKPSWRDTSLSAHIDVDSNTLQVQLNKSTVFQIFCKPYDNDVRSEITKKFTVLEEKSYPTTLALLPNSLLIDPVAENLFLNVDEHLSNDSTQFYGHYVLVVGKKPNIPEVDGYKNTISYIEKHNIVPQLIEHRMVLSVKDVLNELKITNEVLVKSVVFSIRGKSQKIVCVLPHDKEVNKSSLAANLNLSKSKLKFSTENEILRMGFPIGGIPPFGFPEKEDIRFFIHPSLKSIREGTVFMGVGDNTKTLQMNITDLITLIGNYENLPL